MQGKLDERKMMEYHMRLNQLLNQHKKARTEEGEVSKQNWCTSNLALMFLENSIKRYTDQPVWQDNKIVQQMPI